jgi:hypothetical protein
MDDRYLSLPYRYGFVGHNDPEPPYDTPAGGNRAVAVVKLPFRLRGHARELVQRRRAGGSTGGHGMSNQTFDRRQLIAAAGAVAAAACLPVSFAAAVHPVDVPFLS